MPRKVARISRTAKDYAGVKFRITNEYPWKGRYKRPEAILVISRHSIFNKDSVYKTEHSFSKKELLKLYHGILKMLMSMEDCEHPEDEED